MALVLSFASPARAGWVIPDPLHIVRPALELRWGGLRLRLWPRAVQICRAERCAEIGVPGR